MNEAVDRARAVDEILKTGDFHLQGWLSNSTEFMIAMDSTRTAADHEVLLAGDSETKVLGITWKPAMDVLTFAVGQTDDTTSIREGIASKVSGIFDPMGSKIPTHGQSQGKAQRAWYPRSHLRRADS